MTEITSRSALLVATVLCGGIATTNVYAIQPWSVGVEPLMARMTEIEQLLALNSINSLSEFLTAADALRLTAEKNELLAEKERMARMFEMSHQIRNSSLVNYAVSSDSSTTYRGR